MDKVLIVDDENLTRLGLKETVDWASLNLEVVGDAPNGAIGLEMARSLKPDLIISDVRMPVMDGLEMAKALFDEGADTAVIVYSGYRDFEYVHRAFDSGVAAFLLKPIDNAELSSRIREVMQKLKQKRIGNFYQGQFEKNAPILKKQLLESLLKTNDASFAERLSALGVTVPKTGYVLVCKTKGDAGELLSAACKELVEFENITEVYEGFGVLITSAADETFLRATVTKALRRLTKRTDTRFSVGIAAIDGDVANAFGVAVERSKSLLFSAVNAVATDTSGVQFKTLVRDALKIIETEYDKDLSIKYVAKKLLVSESHLMHEFKEQTGKRFNECLMEFRILKAEELLTSGKLRVNEVARAVGYGDPRYFAQVFKEQTGMPPSEYVLKRRNED